MDLNSDQSDLDCFGFADAFFTCQRFKDGYIITADFGFGIASSVRVSGEQAERFIRSLQPISEQGEHESGARGEGHGPNTVGTGSGSFELYNFKLRREPAN